VTVERLVAYISLHPFSSSVGLILRRGSLTVGRVDNSDDYAFQ
jgi:hypothetical protein